MKKRLIVLMVVGVMAFASFARAQGTSQAEVTLTPGAVAASGSVVGVPHDGAPEFERGSFRTNGVTKGEIYIAPEALFAGRQVLVGDVAEVTYWTKNGETHDVSLRDWYMVIYTKPYVGQLPVGSKWYGLRLGAEPRLALNLRDAVNKWVRWSLNGRRNQLTWYESTYNNFESANDPVWDEFVLGTSLPGAKGPGVPYATQPILFISLQTASNWSLGYSGQVDGLTVRLKDGSSATVNFEATLKRRGDGHDHKN